MDGIFFIPLLIVLSLVFGCRHVAGRKPLGIGGSLVSVSLVLVSGLFLPLTMGVWLPDVFGKQHTLCSGTTSTGYQVSIVQYWNHVDFYTTEARITAPDGLTSTTILDGDASKAWSGTLEMDPSQKGATYRLPDGRTGKLTW